MKQRLVSVVALIALVLSIGITVSASEVSPRWDAGKPDTDDYPAIEEGYADAAV